MQGAWRATRQAQAVDAAAPHDVPDVVHPISATLDVAVFCHVDQTIFYEHLQCLPEVKNFHDVPDAG